MIEAKETLVGNIASSSFLEGSLNKAIEYVEPTTQEKTITPSQGEQIVLPDDGVFALSKVTIEPIPSDYVIPNGTLDITENGTYDVTNYKQVNTDIHEVTKYKPRFVRFDAYRGTELREELQNLDTSLITDMSNMFANSKLTEIDLNGFDTRNVTNISNMFTSCTSLKEVDVSMLNTSNVTDMNSIFSYSNNLEKINVSNIDTSKVKNMGNMFFRCSKITKMDISHFDTSSVTNTGYMFNGCSQLTTLIINNPKVFPMTNTSMFTSSKIANGTGYVYVPDDLVETYKTATNWSTYANQIKGISELPEGI